MKYPARWLDISVSLYDGMAHWPKDPEVRIRAARDIRKGDSCTVRLLSMGSHTGTHMDAPSHFLKGGRPIDRMPIESTVGPARVILIKDQGFVTVRELEGKNIRSGERILFKTRNSTRCWKGKKFVKDFVYVSEPAAAYLARKRVRMVGIDYLSVGSFYLGGSAVHKKLLEAGIWIVEGLDLGKVSPGRYDLICLPLKILNGDGAPARAVLKKIS